MKKPFPKPLGPCPQCRQLMSHGWSLYLSTDTPVCFKCFLGNHSSKRNV